MKIPVLASVILAGLTAGGCTRLDRDAGFADVRQQVDDRTGMRVHWNRGSAADAEAVQAVRDLQSRTITAESAVQIALLANQDIQAAYAQLGVAQADLVQAGLLKNPVFNIEARFFDAGTALEMGVVGSFLDIFFIPMRKRLAASAFAVAKAEVTDLVLDLALRTSTAFFDAEAAAQHVELCQSVLAATAGSYELACRLHAAGNITDLDRDQERSLHEQSRLDLATAQLRLVDAREKVNVLMGAWGEATAWRSAGRLADPPDAADLPETIERQAVARNVGLETQRQRVRLAAQRLGVARPFAMLDEGEVGVTAEREPDGEWGVGPQFTIPIPIFDQGQAAELRSSAELDGARAQYIALAVRVRAQARLAFARLDTAHATARYLRQIVLPLRARIVGETQRQYNAMQVSAFQLLQAKREHIEDGGRYVDALRSYWSARATVDAIIAGHLPDAGGAGNGEAMTGAPQSATDAQQRGH